MLPRSVASTPRMKGEIKKMFHKAIVFSPKEYTFVMSGSLKKGKIETSSGNCRLPWYRDEVDDLDFNGYLEDYVKEENWEEGMSDPFAQKEMLYEFFEFIDEFYLSIFKVGDWLEVKSRGLPKRLKDAWDTGFFRGFVDIIFSVLDAKKKKKSKKKKGDGKTNIFDMNEKEVLDLVDEVVAKYKINFPKTKTYGKFAITGAQLTKFLLCEIVQRKKEKMNLYYLDLFVIAKLFKDILTLRSFSGLHFLSQMWSLSGIYHCCGHLAEQKLFLQYSTLIPNKITNLNKAVNKSWRKFRDSEEIEEQDKKQKKKHLQIILGGVSFHWGQKNAVIIDSFCQYDDDYQALAITLGSVESSFLVSSITLSHFIAELFRFNCFITHVDVVNPKESAYHSDGLTFVEYMVKAPLGNLFSFDCVPAEVKKKGKGKKGAKGKKVAGKKIGPARQMKIWDYYFIKDVIKWKPAHKTLLEATKTVMSKKKVIVDLNEKDILRKRSSLVERISGSLTATKYVFDDVGKLKYFLNQLFLGIPRRHKTKLDLLDFPEDLFRLRCVYKILESRKLKNPKKIEEEILEKVLDGKKKSQKEKPKNKKKDKSKSCSWFFRRNKLSEEEESKQNTTKKGPIEFISRRASMVLTSPLLAQLENGSLKSSGKKPKGFFNSHASSDQNDYLLKSSASDDM